MYVKIYPQILDSSIADDYEKRDVFQDMLILADRNGEVDKTYEAIAARTRRPIELVKAKIKELMEPDPASRSYKANGARLVLLDPGQRTWGWRIVNYKHYRNLHSEEERSQFFRGRRRRRFVYYALCEDHVRIGLNSNAWAAITKLRVTCPGVQLGAKELGDETLLRRRHEEFARDFIGDGWFRLSRKLQEQIAIIAANGRRTAPRTAKDSTRIAKDSHRIAKDSQDSQFVGEHFIARIAIKGY